VFPADSGSRPAGHLRIVDFVREIRVEFLRRGAEQPVDREDRSPQLGVKYKDLVVMHQLMEAGADFSQPRDVVHYFYACSLESAQALARAVRELQCWEVDVRDPLPESPGRWRVVCETRAIISPELVRATGDIFDFLAAEHKAEYDGWKATV
jgi:hypothetical protein